MIMSQYKNTEHQYSTEKQLLQKILNQRNHLISSYEKLQRIKHKAMKIIRYKQVQKMLFTHIDVIILLITGWENVHLTLCVLKRLLCVHENKFYSAHPATKVTLF